MNRSDRGVYLPRPNKRVEVGDEVTRVVKQRTGGYPLVLSLLTEFGGAITLDSRHSSFYTSHLFGGNVYAELLL